MKKKTTNKCDNKLKSTRAFSIRWKKFKVDDMDAVGVVSGELISVGIN